MIYLTSERGDLLTALSRLFIFMFGLLKVKKRVVNIVHSISSERALKVVNLPIVNVGDSNSMSNLSVIKHQLVAPFFSIAAQPVEETHAVIILHREWRDLTFHPGK